MKKVILAISLILASFVSLAGNQQVNGIISLQVGIDDPTNNEVPFPKTPIIVPQVWLDGHEVSFQTLHPAYTLLLMDDDDVVFTYNLPSNGSNVFLPEWLSGEYQIVLRPSGCNYYFYGYIELQP